MAYRGDRHALEALVAELDREWLGLVGRREGLERQLRLERRGLAAGEARLAEAGPGAGPRSARRDRIGLGTLTLVAVGLALLPLHLKWHRFASLDATVIPAILLLGVPGLLAAVSGWPYRRESAWCRFSTAAGLLLAFLPLASLLWAGLGRGAWR